MPDPAHAGRRLAVASGATREIRGPDDGPALGTVSTTPVDAVGAVVDGAADAQREWADRPVSERAGCLERGASLLDAEADELGRLLAAESGKPLAQARFEVGGAIALLRGNAAEGRRLGGRVLPTEGNAGTERDLAWTRREPLGVVGAIIPFNFPAELVVEKCAAALVAGNAVVVKPPAEDPLTATRVHAAMVDAGIPAGAFGLVQGGRDVGEALAGYSRLDAISLTGSTAAGTSVARAAAPRLRALHLELGGNNACLVLADADLELVAAEVAFGRLMMNGQACSASKRIIVDRRVHDELTDRLSAVVRRQVVGPATDPATTIGPLITAAAAGRVASQVARARAAGAALATAGGQARGPYFAPCVLAGTPVTADLAQDDEIFGPVFALIPVDGPREALAVANASSYGLMGSVFTRDLELAVALAERMECGGVVVNGTDNYRPPIIPFHGVKMSGRGREGLGYTLEELTREKTIVLRRFRRGLGSA